MLEHTYLADAVTSIAPDDGLPTRSSPLDSIVKPQGTRVVHAVTPADDGGWFLSVASHPTDAPAFDDLPGLVPLPADGAAGLDAKGKAVLAKALESKGIEAALVLEAKDAIAAAKAITKAHKTEGGVTPSK